jgi:hypothetical protein
MNEQVLLDKLTAMHTDIKITKERLHHVIGDIHDHEIILRGENKMNGLVGEVHKLKTAQSAAHKVWFVLVTTLTAVFAWAGLK